MKPKKIAPAQPSPRLAPARLSAQSFAQSDVLSSEAVESLKSAMDGATHDEYEGVRMAWMGAYSEARKCTEEAASKAFSRLKSLAGIEKPKSEKPASVEKQASREALKGLDVATINVEIAEQAPKAAQGDSKAFSRVKALRTELERRAKETSKGAQETEKRLRKDIADCIKGLSLENLHRVQAFIATLSAPASIVAPEKKARALKKAA